MKPIECINIYKSLRILPTGECSNCCIQEIIFKDVHGNMMYPHENTFDEILNSYTANQIRESFQKGERHYGCNKCWIEEDIGIESKRQKDLNYYPEFIPTIINNPKLIEVIILDINVSNLCNLKCRTCDGSRSSLWASECKKIFPKKIEAINLITKKIENTHKDSSLFWNEYQSNFNNLKYIDFYGGEPFLIKKQIDLLKFSVDENTSKNINVHFNTNCTIWNDNIFNIVKEFKHINMAISIDAINEKATYIRHPSNWNKVFNNFKLMYKSQLSLDNFLMVVCCSVSNLNVFYLDEVLDVIEPYVNVYLNIVYNIECFSIRCMPEELKDEVSKKIKPSLIKYNKGDKILNFMYSKKYDESQWKFFIDRMSIYDKHRNEKFSETFPEFYSLIKKYGYYYGNL